jgi:hypothetical protein
MIIPVKQPDEPKRSPALPGDLYNLFPTPESHAEKADLNRALLLDNLAKKYKEAADEADQAYNLALSTITQAERILSANPNHPQKQKIQEAVDNAIEAAKIAKEAAEKIDKSYTYYDLKTSEFKPLDLKKAQTDRDEAIEAVKAATAAHAKVRTAHQIVTGEINKANPSTLAGRINLPQAQARLEQAVGISLKESDKRQKLGNPRVSTAKIYLERLKRSKEIFEKIDSDSKVKKEEPQTTQPDHIQPDKKIFKSKPKQIQPKYRPYDGPEAVPVDPHQVMPRF